MKKLSDILNIIVFFGFTAVIAIVSFCIPKQSFSETENRYLAEAPKLSVRGYFSGNTAKQISEYLDDSFPMRTNWISLHTSLELLQGRKEVNGVYILEDRMLGLAHQVDYKNIEPSLDAVKKLCSITDAQVYMLAAPTAAHIYSDKMYAFGPCLDQKQFVDYIYDYLDGDLTAIYVFDELKSNRDDYIYYRTDHHWTQRGAYIAYTVAAKSMGHVPVGQERFNIRHASHSFLGSLHSKTMYNQIEADTIDFYISNAHFVTLDCHNTDNSRQDSLYSQEYLSVKDKYLCYTGENSAIKSLYSTADGGRLLVIKDSYANCFVQFLAEHYSWIDMIDLRYMTDPSDYIDLDNYDSVLIIYNAVNLSEDNNLRKLSLLG